MGVAVSKLYPDYRRNPRLADLSSDAVDVLCAILFAHPAYAASGMEGADFVDTFVTLQDAGYATLKCDGERFWVELHEDGASFH